MNLLACVLIVFFCQIPQVIPQNKPKQIYELVAWNVVMPQWLKTDAYTSKDEFNVRETLRFPPKERRYIGTNTNQELIVYSTRDLQLMPKASEILRILKQPNTLFDSKDYSPLLSTGMAARHQIAEGMNIRIRNTGATDEVLVFGLYMPLGWPFLLCLAYLTCLIIVPALGAFLVHASFQVAHFYKLVIWGPIKTVWRWMLIKEQLSIRKWQKHIAPSHFLEPRFAWKLPYYLRHEKTEDIPYELTDKPPINKIDYTWYLLTEEDVDEMDLTMDEMEWIDDLLQFRDENPKEVARLLKYRLGVEKFYNFFDEDILSDESDGGGDTDAVPPEEGVDMQVGQQTTQLDYMKLLEMDEPWMHDDFDDKFTGPPAQLEEIRKRRIILNQLKEEIRYFHNILMKDNMFDKNFQEGTDEDRRKALKKANKLMDKFARFSKVTKERIREIEPSEKKQIEQNTALSKYLPLVDQMSHYNHRLNLKHEKQRDPQRRKVQLAIFGGP